MMGQKGVFNPGEVVGITSANEIPDLKRVLLVMDRIIMIHPSSDWVCRTKNPAHAADLAWLEERNYVVKAGASAAINGKGIEYEDGVLTAHPAIEPILHATAPYLKPLLDDLCCRAISAGLREQYIDSVSLHPPNPFVDSINFTINTTNNWLEPGAWKYSIGGIINAVKGQTVRNGFVLDLTMRKLPTPDATTSLDRIIEFRKDPSAYASLLALRQWIGKVQTANQSPIEVAQELDYLLAQYGEHLRLHEIKTQRNTVEAVVTFVAEAAEDLAKVRWGKLAQSLFTVRRQQIALLEAEASAPGRSIAYVWKAKKAFPDQEDA